MMFNEKSWDDTSETGMAETGRRKQVAKNWLSLSFKKRREWVVRKGCHQHTKLAETGCRNGLSSTYKEGRNGSLVVHVVVNVQRSMKRAVVNHYVQERLRHIRNGSLLLLFKEEGWNAGSVLGTGTDQTKKDGTVCWNGLIRLWSRGNGTQKKLSHVVMGLKKIEQVPNKHKMTDHTCIAAGC